MSLDAILILVSVILFVLAAIGIPASRVSLGWLGLAFFAVSFLTGHIS